MSADGSAASSAEQVVGTEAGSETSAQWDLVPEGEMLAEPEGEDRLFQEAVQEQLELRPHPERLNWLGMGCKVLQQMQKAEFTKAAEAFAQPRSQARVFHLWALSARASAMRKHRLRRALSSWHLMATDEMVKLRCSIEDAQDESRKAMRAAAEARDERLSRDLRLGIALLAALGGSVLIGRNLGSARALRKFVDEKMLQSSDALNTLGAELQQAIDENDSKQSRELKQQGQELRKLLDEDSQKQSELLKKHGQELAVLRRACESNFALLGGRFLDVENKGWFRSGVRLPGLHLSLRSKL